MEAHKGMSLKELQEMAVVKDIPPSGNKDKLIDRINNGIVRKSAGRPTKRALEEDTSLLSPKQAWFKKTRPTLIAELDTQDPDILDEELDRRWALYQAMLSSPDKNDASDVESEVMEDVASYLKARLPLVLKGRLLEEICDANNLTTVFRDEDDDNKVKKLSKDVLVDKIISLIENVTPEVKQQQGPPPPRCAAEQLQERTGGV